MDSARRPYPVSVVDPFNATQARDAGRDAAVEASQAMVTAALTEYSDAQARIYSARGMRLLKLAASIFATGLMMYLLGVAAPAVRLVGVILAILAIVLAVVVAYAMGD